MSITSKVLKKDLIINNYLEFNSYRVNFESLIRPEVKESSKSIPIYLKKLVSKLNYNVLIIGGILVNIFSIFLRTTKKC